MKNGIKIAALGLVQLAIATQANAQLLITSSQVALNLPPVVAVPIKDIPNMDLVAIQSVKVAEVSELDLSQLGDVVANKGATEAKEVAVTFIAPTVVATLPPSTIPSSIVNNNNVNNNINNNSSGVSHTVVVTINNSNPAFPSAFPTPKGDEYTTVNYDDSFVVLYADRYAATMLGGTGNNDQLVTIKKPDGAGLFGNADNLVAIKKHDDVQYIGNGTVSFINGAGAVSIDDGAVTLGR